jgi:hypothetical protein
VANDVFEHINNGRTRVVRGRPVLNQSGTNVITVTVHDEHGGTASIAVNLRVLPANDPPTISAIPAASTSVGQSTAELPFTIHDVDSPLDELTLSARSSNTNLAPIANIEFSGTGSNRTVRVTPAPDQTGFAMITVEVADSNGARATSFELLVNDTNGPPVIVLQPQDQRVYTGAAATFRVLATGPGLLAYQWQKDGTDLPGQTTPILALTSVQRSDRGAYRALVNNVNGSTASAPANLEVYDAARILSASRTGVSVEVICESTLGQRYTLEYHDNLVAGPWTSLNTIDGTGGPITFVDPSATASSRFYRVRIE